MAAAVEARAAGLSVIVVDEGRPPAGRSSALGRPRAATVAAGPRGRRRPRPPSRSRGRRLRPRATLWARGRTGCAPSVREGAAEIGFGRLLLATGAQERPVPIPGWTLPGVMGVGAAQILLKTAGAVPGGPAGLAGQGPLAWLLAVQLLRAGPGLDGMLETRGRARSGTPVRPGGLWTAAAPATKGSPWCARPGATACRSCAASATCARRARTASAASAGRRRGRLRHAAPARGVMPSTHVSRALGLEHHWDEAQRCWRPALDEWGAAPRPRRGRRRRRRHRRLGSGGGHRAHRRHRRRPPPRPPSRHGGHAPRRAASRPARRRPGPAPLPGPPLRTGPGGARPEDDATSSAAARRSPLARCARRPGWAPPARTRPRPISAREWGPARAGCAAPPLPPSSPPSAARRPDQVDPFRTRFPTKPLSLGELASLAG